MSLPHLRPASIEAWLEFPSGDRIDLGEMCTLGRAPGNRVVIPSERVSRRHAVIRRVGNGTFQFIDLGSSNGTYLNGQRLERPVPLRDGCVIEIGSQKMVFRMPPARGISASENEVIDGKCWLLVLDATQRGCHTPCQDFDGKTFQSWSERCQRVVSQYRGVIMRALNDGLLAYWRADNDGNAATVATALNSLRSFQLHTDEFRFALHYGLVTLRGSPAGGLVPTGNEVIYTVQLQRLARAFDTLVLISEAANAQLGNVVKTRPLTMMETRGYRGKQIFYTAE